MTDTDTTYNGWSNHATWCVKLWLDNDEGTYGDARDLAQSAHDAENTSEVWSVDQARRFKLSEDLREYVESLPDVASVLENGSGLAVDLFTTELQRVDWDEIAAAYIEEFWPTGG